MLSSACFPILLRSMLRTKNLIVSLVMIEPRTLTTKKTSLTCAPSLKYTLPPSDRADDQEILRWRPINKFGNNHYLTQDDWYNGFFIPKNSVIMANWWAIHYDERYFSDPFTVPHLTRRSG